MSSLSSISGGGTLSTFLQRLSSANSASSTSNQLSVTPDTLATSSSISAPATDTTGQTGATGFFAQVQSAVTDAIQTAQSSGSTQTPDQIVQGAIAKVVQQNGLPGGQSGVHGGHHHHHGGHAPAASADSSSTATALADTSDTTDPSGADTDPSGDGSPEDAAASSFFKTLSSFGVDPKQFHQDFVSAVSNAQSGTGNTSGAFASVPIGTSVDTYA